MVKRDEDGKIPFSNSGLRKISNEIANIFNKYYQSDPNDNGRGLGLGLAIISRIVSLAKGQVMGESEKDGGSTFTFYLSDASFHKTKKSEEIL